MHPPLARFEGQVGVRGVGGEHPVQLGSGAILVTGGQSGDNSSELTREPVEGWRVLRLELLDRRRINGQDLCQDVQFRTPVRADRELVDKIDSHE